MEQEEKVASKRRKTLERELDWVRQGAKGRQTKQKARLQNYDKLLNEDQKELDEKLEIYIPNGPRLGTNVIEAKECCQSFWRQIIIRQLKLHSCHKLELLELLGQMVPVNQQSSE